MNNFIVVIIFVFTIISMYYFEGNIQKSFPTFSAKEYISFFILGLGTLYSIYLENVLIFLMVLFAAMLFPYFVDWYIYYYPY